MMIGLLIALVGVSWMCWQGQRSGRMSFPQFRSTPAPPQASGAETEQREPK